VSFPERRQEGEVEEKELGNDTRAAGKKEGGGEKKKKENTNVVASSAVDIGGPAQKREGGKDPGPGNLEKKGGDGRWRGGGEGRFTPYTYFNYLQSIFGERRKKGKGQETTGKKKRGGEEKNRKGGK